MLPDECNCALLEKRFAQVVDRAHKPYKYIGALWHTPDLSIPAMAIGCCAENHLPPSIEYPEIIDALDPYCDRIDAVIFSIIIWGERSRYKDGWVGLEYFYQYRCGIRTSRCIVYSNGIPDAVEAAVVNTYWI